ncbi:MAG TPA: hypothetical protein VII06_40830 [Chloroflexota bacterium]|jgi:hypothetical protein
MSSDDPRAARPEDAEAPSVPVTPHPYAYVTVRLTAAEFDQVAAAARAAGQTLPEFVYDAAIARASPDA